MNVNWRWPSTPKNGLRPWYSILRAICAYPIVLVGAYLLLFGAMIGWGVDEARKLKHDINL